MRDSKQLDDRRTICDIRKHFSLPIDGERELRLIDEN